MESATNINGRELVIGPESRFSLQHLRDLWDTRELLWMLAERDIRVRYKQAILGMAWAVLQPVTQMLLFTILFNRFAGISSGSELPYPLFSFSGLVAWNLFSSGLSHASESLVAGSNLVTKVYFPRAVLPLSAIGTAVVDFVICFPLVLALAWWLGVPLHATAPLALPVALLAALCAAALGLWTSALNLQYRDMRCALPFFMQLLVFVTPVFYPATLVPARWRGLLALNPMAAVVEGFRAALFGQPLPWARLALALAVTLVVGTLGFIRFRSLERTFADRV
jgi:lipopolysaccharide transport system permease protein